MRPQAKLGIDPGIPFFLGMIAQAGLGQPVDLPRRFCSRCISGPPPMAEPPKGYPWLHRCEGFELPPIRARTADEEES